MFSNKNSRKIIKRIIIFINYKNDIFIASIWIKIKQSFCDITNFFQNCIAILLLIYHKSCSQQTYFRHINYIEKN